MLVEHLIRELQKLDQEAVVVLGEMDGGWSNIDNITSAGSTVTISSGDDAVFTDDKCGGPLYYEELLMLLRGGNFQTIRDSLPEYEVLYSIPQHPEYHPEGDVGTHTELVIEYAVSNEFTDKLLLAAFLHDFGKGACFKASGNLHGHGENWSHIVKSACIGLCIPEEDMEFAILVSKVHTKVHCALGKGKNKRLKPRTILALFEEIGAIDNVHMLDEVLVVCMADHHGRGITADGTDLSKIDYVPIITFLSACLDAVTVDMTFDQIGMSDVELRHRRLTQLGNFIKEFTEGIEE